MISGPYYGPDSRHAHTMGRIAGGFYHESDNARESDDARCGNTPCEYPRSSIPPWIGHSLLARLERCLSRREVAARAAAQRASWAPGFPTACPSPVLARTIWSAGILTCELPKVLVCIGRTASSSDVQFFGGDCRGLGVLSIVMEGCDRGLIYYSALHFFYDLCHFWREKKNSQHHMLQAFEAVSGRRLSRVRVSHWQGPMVEGSGAVIAAGTHSDPANTVSVWNASVAGDPCHADRLLDHEEEIFDRYAGGPCARPPLSYRVDGDVAALEFWDAGYGREDGSMRLWAGTSTGTVSLLKAQRYEHETDAEGCRLEAWQVMLSYPCPSAVASAVARDARVISHGGRAQLLCTRRCR